MESKSIYELNRIQRYMMQMRPVLYKQVLFSDGTADYREPPEPKEGEEVTIRFRTKKDNVDAVFLCGNGQEYQMKKEETCEEFDYYAYTVVMTDQPFDYYFQVADGKPIMMQDVEIVE